ncbi:MAG TPA: proton-conducting transporter membrane subunit [Streptosporangiaceae bacterium]|nr:proton-conducting transporter membrane subunit [Streptosporangiaceae bacterium]
MNGLFGAGLILLALAAAADFLGGRFMRSGPLYLIGAAGAGCLAAAGGFALTGRLVTLDVAGWLGDPIPGQRAAALAADRLSGLFLAMAFGAALPISVAFASWARRQGPRPGRLGASYALALGAVAVIVTATDAFTALFGWEALTVAFYLLAGAERGRRDRAGAAQITFAFGKLSGAALLIGLLLAAGSHSILLASFTHVPGGAPRTTAQVLLLAGFAVKAGLVPFQVWLPRGYAAAPGPARAIMAGVCVNVAFYGMWRTLALLGRAPGWLVGAVLVLGAVTALLGIAHAAVQNRLSRVIAYSSIENTGLIVTGFGVALTGAAVGNRTLVAVGLLAATLQMVAHTAAKSLLFTSAAGIEAGAGPDDLEQLRAHVGGRGGGGGTPWSGFGLVVGSVTLAGLPPSVGFVSEWFLLESLMQQFRVPGLGYRLVLALAGASVALTAGFAGVTFVRLVGLVVKRNGPEPVRGAPLTYGWAGRAAVLVLSVCCLAIAAVTPLEIRVIAAGLSPVVPGGLVMGALKSPWVLQPVFAGFSILSPSWLWLEMPLMLLVVVAFCWLVSGRRMLRVRRVPAWRSATMGVDGLDSYTAFGYANPTRRVLAGVLHTRAGVQEVMLEHDEPDPGSGPPDRDEQAEREQAAHLRYASDVVEVVETYLYRPALRSLLAVSAVSKRLQSGRLDAYLLYMLIALIAIIAVVTALA